MTEEEKKLAREYEEKFGDNNIIQLCEVLRTKYCLNYIYIKIGGENENFGIAKTN